MALSTGERGEDVSDHEGLAGGGETLPKDRIAER